MAQFHGRTIKGYELLELIGEGGFGAVYHAHQLVVEREVAFKIILPQYANQPDFIRRFEAEAQVIARLEHLHIVPLYDYWREPDGAYLVMRWLRGGNLRKMLLRYGHLEIETVARILDQIGSALAMAHRQGVIHRDIKPDNILLDEEGNAYLADFGIAIHPFNKEQAPSHDVRMGSPPYISPEQILGQSVLSQSDVYSLGIVLFELLTGRPPFSGGNNDDIMRKHLGEPVPYLQNFRPDLPNSLNFVIWRATAKSWGARYDDVLELAKDFRKAVTGSSANPDPSALSMSPSPSIPLKVPVGTETIDFDKTPKGINPYKGLRPFQEADVLDFFGRDELVKYLLQKLGAKDKQGRFLAVVGPSGSGKSSLVKAGLVPALRRGDIEDSQNWFYVLLTPGDHPFQELENALLRVAMNAPPDLLETLKRDETGLLEAVDRILPPGNAELILVIDQFEELFTLTSDENERQLFLQSLHNAVMHSISRIRLIITLRADYYDRPLLYAGFGDLVRTGTEVVLPLSSSELVMAIRGPAERVGLVIEPDLITTIVLDVNHEPGALPLLQYALTELFERRQGNQLTLGTYQLIGGLLGALARRADEIYEELSLSDQETARQVFLRLVVTNEGGEGTRRRVLQEELLSLTSRKQSLFNVIDAFAKYRLLTLDHEPSTRMPTLELAHEALIREWQRLKNWIENNRDDLHTHRRLSTATTEWLNTERDASFLASGSRLTQFELLVENHSLALNNDERTFINASLELQRRAANRTRNFIAALIIFSLLALGLAAFAFDRQNRAVEAQQQAVIERDRADLQARTSTSRAVAVTALTNLPQLDLSLLLGVEALHIQDTFEARNSLLTALQYRPRLSRFLYGQTDAVRSVSFSPDGHLVASGGRDHRVIVWDVSTGQPLFPPLEGHTDSVNHVAFSPDGQLLASSSLDGTVRLWDTKSGKSYGQPLSGGEAVWSVAFSPDGKFVAAGNAAGEIKMWNTGDLSPVDKSFRGHTDLIYSLAFSPDGQFLASSSADGTVRLWDVATGNEVGGTIRTSENPILTIAFSPDSKLLASGGADQQIVLSTVPAGDVLLQLPGDNAGWVRGLAFDPSGRLLASVGDDGLVKLWDVFSGQTPIESLSGHTDQIWDVAFSSDGKTLVSAGRDGRVILWDTAPNDQSLGSVFDGYSETISRVVFSPDGKFLASADGFQEGVENAVRLWDVKAGKLTNVLKGHVGPVSDIAFSPDGSLLASASYDKSVRLWNMATGQTIGDPLVGQVRAVLSLAFNPIGDTLAAGYEDGSITLWDVKARIPREQPLMGHNAGVLTLDFSPDGKFLASGSQDGSIIVWNMATGQPASPPLTGHTNSVTQVAFSPDGHVLASSSRDGTIIIWDAETFHMVGQPLVGHTDYVLGLAFSPDSKMLASASADKHVILWDITAGRPLGQPFVGHTDWVTGIAFSPDGQLLATGGLDRHIILWDVSLASWEDRACFIANRPVSSEERGLYLTGMPDQTICQT